MPKSVFSRNFRVRILSYCAHVHVTEQRTKEAEMLQNFSTMYVGYVSDKIQTLQNTRGYAKIRNTKRHCDNDNHILTY